MNTLIYILDSDLFLYTRNLSKERLKPFFVQNQKQLKNLTLNRIHQIKSESEIYINFQHFKYPNIILINIYL